jgi:hypothetical protein
MKRKYWLKEKPAVVMTRANVFRYFENADVLHVSLPDWVDHHGNLRFGETVAINMELLRKNPGAIEYLRDVVFHL